jgi:branched-chain amino acid transport system permease protein
MIRVVAAVVNGLTLGGTFALIALGLVLAFRATRTFNFAHGELLLLPAFIVGYAQLNHMNIWLAIVLALVVSALVGAAIYAGILRRTTGLPLFMGIVATLGVAAILDGLMGILFQAPQYTISIRVLPKGHVGIFGARISQSSLAVAAISIGLAVAVTLVVRFTHLGKVIRAAGQDPLLASQCGIPVRRLYLASWAGAAVLAAVGGILYGSSQVVNTSMVNLGLAAVPAIVLGGMDSVEGAVVGGVIIGLAQSFTQTYLGGNDVNPVTYVLLLIVLLAAPEGLFGTKEVVRA